MSQNETDIQNSITAFRYGAMDYILKPMTVTTVREAIDKATEIVKEQEMKVEGLLTSRNSARWSKISRLRKWGSMTLVPELLNSPSWSMHYRNN